ncbi:DUF5060 domain-containing protein, partial [Paenibacillus nasutitermitis]|uniref:DUF5060 domain-containing protein n=1 Tax=Paenibacillus nasutitermitis TaxID=1652958 RepID=UPI00166795EE
MVRNRKGKETISVFMLLCLLISIVGSGGLAVAAPVEMKVDQWKVAEITLTSTVSYDNPFMDNEISATFNGPGNTVITLPGYWDGGNTWKVRFAPTLPGAWSYIITSADTSNAGLHNQTGKIVATPYKGKLEIYKHGFLRISDNGRYFT